MSGSNNTKNSSEETVPLAEHEALKKEHETLIKILEETGKMQREEAKEETEKWKNKFVEMEKKVEKLENDIEDLLIPLDESEMNGMDSAAVEENGNATSNTVSDEGVITISDDDDDRGNEGETNGGYDKPSRQKPVFSFII